MISTLIGITALFMDIAIRTFLDLGVWSPDLLLMAILYLGLTRPLGEAYLLAFFLGLAWDIIYLDITGLHGFLFVLATMMTGKLRRLFWAQYAISRLFIGFVVTCLVRFGEIMFWLSNLDTKVPVSMPERYILYGPIVTGICFLFFFPMRVKPLEISQRTPQTLFTER
ncbi:rod shape-determining protein MreD [bacterium]|nr:rod shape-determining protein MreD [bacterium]